VATDIDVIELGEEPGRKRTAAIRSPRPRWPIAVFAALLGAAILGRLVLDTGSDDAASAPATSMPSVTVAQTTAPDAPRTAREAPPGRSEIAFTPLPGVAAGPVTVATGGDRIRMWSVDLDAGRAVELAVPAIPAAPIADVRFFGPGRAVAILEDGAYATLDVGDATVDLDRIVDLGTRRSLGLEALTPDGEAVWVGIPAGLIRWNLRDDSVDHRWIDAVGDHVRPPQPRGVVEQGLVVEAAGRTFLLSGERVTPLGIDGEVVATAGDWLVARRCDDALRCGQLSLLDIGSGLVVELPAEKRFRADCGLAAPGRNGSVHVVLHRLGSTELVTIGPDGATEYADVLPIGLACVEAIDVGGAVLVAHERGLVVMRDGVPTPVGVALGQVIAVGGP